MSILFGLDEVQDEASQDIVAAVRAGILLCLCLCKRGLPVLTLSCSSANFAPLRLRYQSGRLWSPAGELFEAKLASTQIV